MPPNTDSLFAPTTSSSSLPSSFLLPLSKKIWPNNCTQLNHCQFFQAFGCLHIIAEDGPPTLKSDSLRTNTRPFQWETSYFCSSFPLFFSLSSLSALTLMVEGGINRVSPCHKIHSSTLGSLTNWNTCLDFLTQRQCRKEGSGKFPGDGMQLLCSAIYSRGYRHFEHLQSTSSSRTNHFLIFVL